MTPATGTAGDPRRLALLELREAPLGLPEVLAAVEHPAAGGVASFCGYVRDEDGGRAVRLLGYSAHPTAVERLRQVAEGVARAYPVVRLAAVHRLGTLQVGELAVAVAVACPHRAEAFQAARQLIDELKAEVPIWKHQVFADGSEEWVGAG